MDLQTKKTFQRFIIVSSQEILLKKNMISVNFAYTDYISNWADISCALWGILSAQNALFRNTYEVEKWLLRAFNAIAPSSAIAVCWGYFVSTS